MLICLQQGLEIIEFFIVGKYGSALCELDIRTVAEKAGVGTMHLLLHYPFKVGGHLFPDLLHEVSGNGILYGAVLFKLKHFFDFLCAGGAIKNKGVSTANRGGEGL